jgi:hypothetical protein
VRHRPEPDTVLATIRYIRIVDPDEPAKRLGNDGWNEMLRRLRSHIHKEYLDEIRQSALISGGFFASFH